MFSSLDHVPQDRYNGQLVIIIIISLSVFGMLPIDREPLNCKNVLLLLLLFYVNTIFCIITRDALGQSLKDYLTSGDLHENIDISIIVIQIQFLTIL